MDRRFIQLFKILSRQKDYITAAALCEQLGIRPRTLREDIRQYKSVIENEAGCEIESKPHAGYRLIVHDETRYHDFLKRLLQEESSHQFLIPIHQEERIHYMIRYFLSHQDYVRLDDLADEIYVSRSTINTDIKAVKERLSRYHLKLVTRAGYGLKISGKEQDIRSCIAQYFYHTDDYDRQYIQGMNVHSIFLDAEAFAFIKQALYETISAHGFKLTDFGFQNLSIHLLIAVGRIRQKTYIEDYPRDADRFRDRPEMRIAIDLAARLNEHFHILVPSNEIFYITIHLMGKESLESGDQVLDSETLRVADAILAEIKQVFHVDFSGDLELYTMLTVHLQPMIHRLQYGLKIANPMVEQIKKDNPDAFEMAIVAGGGFKPFLRPDT